MRARRLPATMPRPWRIFLGALLSVASLLMMLVLILFIATVGVTTWLSATTTGQQWLAAQVRNAAADTGYTVDIGAIRPIGAGRILIERATISQNDAPLADVSHLSVRPSLVALLNGHAAVDLELRQLTLYSTPAAQPSAITATLPTATAITTLLAVLPFDKVSLSRLQIDHLLAADRDMGVTLALHLSKGSDTAKLDGTFELTGAAEQPLRGSLSSRVVMAGETPAIVIESLSVTVDGTQYNVVGQLALPATLEDTVPLPFQLRTMLNGQPLNLSGMLSQQNGLKFEALQLNGPGIAATGYAGQNQTTAAWQGAFETKVSFPQLAAAIPAAAAIPLQDSLSAVVSFDGPALALTIPRVVISPADLRDVRLVTTPLGHGIDRHIALSLKDQASGASLKLTGDLRQDDVGQWRIEKLDSTLNAGNAGTVSVRGRADQQKIDLAATSKTLRLDRLRGALKMPKGTPPLRLDNVDIKMTGTPALPVIEWSSRVTPLELPRGAPSLNADISGRIAGGMANAQARLNSKALREGTATMQQPLALSLMPFSFNLPEGGLNGRANVKGDISGLSGFMPVGLKLSGPLALDITATGSLSAPQTTGKLTWQNGRLKDSNSGLSLQAIDLRGTFDRDSLRLEKFTARDKRKGRMEASGNLTLSPAWPLNAQLKMTDIDPFAESVVAADMPTVDGVFSADLKLTGTRASYLLSGKIGSGRLSIQLPERFGTSVPQLNIVEKRGKKSSMPGLDALRLDVGVSVPREIFVRGWGLDAEFGGTLDIGGTAAVPLVKGSLQSIRGRYEEFGRRFELARARLDFRGAMPPSPYLDITATTRVDGIDANVVLSGSAATPKIDFTSTPSMPREDVLAHILFGSDRASITPTQALQLAQTLRRFSGRGGGLDPLGALRKGFGLDDLSVDSEAEGGASVGAGKYLSDDVYLELNSGAGERGGGAKLKIDLTPNVKVESKVGQDAQAGGGLFWEWEY